MSRYDESSPQAIGTLAAPEIETNPAKPVASGQVCAGADSGVRWDAQAAFAALSDSVPCGILLFGPGGELRALNRPFAETLG